MLASEASAHLTQRGWTLHVDSDKVPIWSCQRDQWCLDASLVDGKVVFYVRHAFDIDADDLEALSVLARVTRKAPDVMAYAKDVAVYCAAKGWNVDELTAVQRDHIEQDLLRVRRHLTWRAGAST